MDNTSEKNTFLSYTPLTTPTAQLLIGQHDQLIELVEAFIQKIFCPHQSCQTCATCLNIRNKQHHSLMWLYPDKTYTIENLNDLFSTITFQLQENELFFFIIQKADHLPSVCANKLLKLIEEPPKGYHFILLAERIEQILPTIISRCITHRISTSQNSTHFDTLFSCFTKEKQPFMVDVSKIIETSTINEQESINLLDKILHHWIIEYKNKKKSSTQELCYIKTIISALKQAYKQLPMPGSCITFWHNIYLQLYPNLKGM